MADRDDWTWEEWGNASIQWRLGVVGSRAGRLLIVGLKSPFLAIRAAHPWVKEVEAWGIFLAVLALTLSLLAFWIDFGDRVNERTVRAWQLLTTPATGNSGKKEALEYLNKEDGLCISGQCLFKLKEPTSLVGIDMSPPDRGELGNPDDDGPGAFLEELQLQAADLRGAIFIRAFLEKADFAGADLTGADLTGAYLGRARLSDANLTRARFGAADLRDALLASADLTDADFTGAYLRNAEIIGANLTDADFTEAVLNHADLTRAKLTGANFTGAYLEQATLYEATLTQADLTNARLISSDLRQASSWRADFTGTSLGLADLSTPILLRQTSLEPS